MFSVDYPTLVQILRQFLHTGLFRAHVVKSRVWSEEGYLELYVKEGSVIACRFVTQQGEASVWDRWDAQLTAMGVLNWELAQGNVPPSKPVPLSQSPFSALPMHHHSSIPQHTLSSDSTQVRLLPMRYRQIYYLIDGNRACADIARMLQKPEQDIVQMMHELVAHGLVVLT